MGFPQYAGKPELLPAYKEEALQYLMTLEVKKRYLAGPRLLKELTGGRSHGHQDADDQGPPVVGTS